MLTFGIVCEFNPFHNGHKRLFREARCLGAERIVCVMSGNAVQRGELAVADKYIRAEAALREGADLVLELPYPWSASSAEHFARAAIYILSQFCDSIIFGSESGNIEYIEKAAELCATENFREQYRSSCESGTGAAEGYLALLREQGFEGISSNDMLGIEYIKAAKRMGAEPKFLTVQRIGGAYNEKDLGADKCPSATALRRAWVNGGVGETEGYIPEEAFKLYTKAEQEGALTDMQVISSALLLALRLTKPKEGIAETEGGIQNRIVALAAESRSAEEFFEKLYTKRYTDAKLRRAVLFLLTDVGRELVFDMPKYTTLLGANAKGRELLSKHRKTEGIRVITKPADAPNCPQLEAEDKLEAIFTLAKATKEKQGQRLKKGAVITE